MRMLLAASAALLLFGCGDSGAVDDASVHDASVPLDAPVDAMVPLDAPSPCTPGATEPCYDGPAETRDVGACRSGMRTCLDARTWGSCDADVLPAAEICANGVDDDCDGSVDDSADADGDGFTVCAGDCCDDGADCPMPALVSPAALELPTDDGAVAVDDDCDGMIDELDASCDAGLAIDSHDPLDAARALGLCSMATSGTSGLVSASFVRADGRVIPVDRQLGLLSSFGPNVTAREGERLLALSSGRARASLDPDACGDPTCTGVGAGTPPPGFPWFEDCSTPPTTIHDDVGLELQLRVPPNVGGFEVDFSFYTHDYPAALCSEYDDTFVILVSPSPDGSVRGNVALDDAGDPIDANTSLGVCSGCPLGTTQLVGTGFDGGGATGWLRTSAPVTPGSEISVRFAIWDSTDATMDSTVLLDRFRWRPLATRTLVGTAPVLP